MSADAVSAAGAGDGDVEDEEGQESVIGYRTLVAAQTVLAFMMRPGGSSAPPISEAGLEAAWRGLDSECGKEELSGLKDGTHSSSSPPSSSSSPPTRGLIDGRVHVLVSLGADGALWLSARPCATAAAADLALALPFFAAARHADVDFDFQLIPAPTANVRKATGAGDALVGGIVWALAVRGEGMAGALRWGLAAAHAVLEHEPEAGRGGAVPNDLSVERVEERRKFVADVEIEYT